MFVVLLCTLAQAARAADADASSRERLVAECDALLAAAVKTPYGWGWKGDAKPAATAGAGRRTNRPSRAATIDVRATAGAGLVLHLAGKSLGEPRFDRAAVQAARALAAVQLNSGQLPAAGVIGANAGGRDAPLAVPSRAATCAALGLFLAIAHDAGDAAEPGASDGPMRRPAMKAAHWLASQQTRWGGWLVTHPADAPPGHGMKLVRLDGVDYRDATVALCLAARVLDDERLRRSARASVEDLGALRTEDEKTRGYQLWTTAYTADRTPLTTVPEFAPAVDTLAARNAMQALLAAAVLVQDESAPPLLREAAAALAKLPKEAGAWRRRYALDAPPARPPAADAPAEPSGEQPRVTSLFGPDAGDGADGGELATPSGVDEVVRATGRLDELGAEGLRRALGEGRPVEDRAALLLCGLRDDALTADSPPPPLDGNAGDGFAARLRGIAAMAWGLPRPGPEEGPGNE